MTTAWTEEEIEYLKENYNRETSSELSKNMFKLFKIYRDGTTVSSKLKRIGLKISEEERKRRMEYSKSKLKEARNFSEKRRDFFKKYYSDKPSSSYKYDR